MNPISLQSFPQGFSFPLRFDDSLQSHEPTFLFPFQQGMYRGALLFNQIKQIQAYITNDQEEQVQAEFIPPFANLFFTTKEQLAAFNTSLPTNYYFTVAKPEGGDFKVYLHPRMKGGVLTEQEKAELENANHFNQLGGTFFKEGKLDEALVELKKCLAIEERLAPGSLAVAGSYNNIGVIFKDQGKFAEALEQYEKCLAIKERLAPNSLTIAASYGNIGLALHDQGKLAQALVQFQKCLAIEERLAPASLTLASSYGNIGKIFHAQGKIDEALDQYQKGLEIQERLVPNSLDVARSYKNIGSVFKAQSDLAQALVQFQKCLAIEERLAPGSLAVAGSYNNIGIIYAVQGKLEEALELFQKYLAIQERLAPSSLAVAESYNNIGNVLKDQGKLDEALELFQKCIALKERLVPNSLTIAASYNNMGTLLQVQGKLDEALKQFQKCLAIEERLAPGSLAVAGSYNNIGVIFKGQGKFAEAMEQYEKCLAIKKHLAPNSLDVARSYNNIGLALQDQGKLDEALELLQKCLAIKKHLAPNSLDVASCYNNIGVIFKAQGKLAEALKQFQKSLTIREHLAPNGLAVAESYNNIGAIFQGQGNLAEAMLHFQKAYSIFERDLITKHPRLISTGNSLALTALKLAEYKQALVYVSKVIQNDPTYKYAYDTKGLILKEQGKLNEALAAFNQALTCDPGYADASIHRLKVVAELAKQNQDERGFAAIAREAQLLPKTDYDERKKQELKLIALASKQESAVELPKPEFEAGSKEYLEQIAKILESFKSQLAVQNARLDEHDVRLQVVEERMDILEGRVLKLEDALTILRAESDRLDRKIAELPQMSPQLHKLLAEKERLHLREEQIKAFNKNTKQRHYFYALLSEMEAAYLAAQVLESGKVSQEKSNKYSTATSYALTAANYASKVINLIPVIGQAASALISSVAYVADTKTSVKNKNDLLRIRSLAPTVADFDQIAIRVAVECTLQNRDMLDKLKSEAISKDWKTKLKSITDGFESLVTEFLKDNETEAKVLGRLEAYKVIAHLQEEAVAENYAIEEEQQERTRHSIIGHQIAKTVKLGTTVAAQAEVSDSKVLSDKCCSIQ